MLIKAKLKRVKRELKILQNLQGGPNIVKLVDFIADSGSKTPAIVYEYLEKVEWRERYKQLAAEEIKIIIYKVLQALEYAHSMGIMHRDIKQQNIIYHPNPIRLNVIDWGLAEFYFPGQEYSVRVASRFFKGPELLLNNSRYDYSLDIWSLGCIFAAMMFRKEPFFYGKDNFDQLVKIVQVMGYEDMIEYVKKFKLNVKDIPISSIHK